MERACRETGIPTTTSSPHSSRSIENGPGSLPLAVRARNSTEKYNEGDGATVPTPDFLPRERQRVRD